MGKIIHRKMNNRGSTLIVVLIIVSFIAILSTVCIASAMVNFKMKVVDKEAKKTFYTAEEAVDEIYNGLGMLSMKHLDQAYQEQLSTLIRQNYFAGADKYVSSNVDNISANAELRKNFTKRVMNEIVNADIWSGNDPLTLTDDTSKQSLVAKLNSFLEIDPSTDANAPRVSAVGDIILTKEPAKDTRLANYTISFQCEVKELKEGNDYFSNVNFNSVIALPDVVVEFSKSMDSKLDTFKNYSLIGNNSIDISKNLTLNQTGMFAGDNGINMSGSMNSGISASSCTIATSGDINVGDDAIFNPKDGSKVWCRNLLGSGSNAIIKIEDSGTNHDFAATYVEDDLQLQGDHSQATIAGDYYGYSYEGNALNNTDAGHTKSSSMIVNGIGSTLNLNNIATLVLGGRAYIDFNKLNGDTYMTGESLALKGDQEAYLVPPSLINYTDNGKSYMNPVPSDKLGKIKVNLTQNNFFGYSYLNPETPYLAVTVENQVYLYLNFSSKEARATYFNCILNDDTFRTLTDSLNLSSNQLVYQAYQNTRNYMKNILRVNMVQLMQTSIVGNGAKIYTNGSLIDANLNQNTVSNVNSSNYKLNGLNVDSFALNALDLKNRYTLITKLLFSPSMYQTDASGNPVCDANGEKIRKIYDTLNNSIFDDSGNLINIQNLQSTSVYSNTVNTEYLQANPTYSENISKNGKKYVMFATNSEATINIDGTGFFQNCSGGVIITNGSVRVSQNFDGLIIARKNITVAENVTINSMNQVNNGYTDLIDFINQGSGGNFKKYFSYWNPTISTSDPKTNSISSISFKNLVTFENWNKK